MFRGSRIALLAGLAGVFAFTGLARADGVAMPGIRPLGTGGAMRGFATGDAGPLLNPSGISLLRLYTLEAGYQYGNQGDTSDARIAAVDSTSAFNIGGALYYTYHRDTPGTNQSETGHLAGGSLSVPVADKIFLGANVKYIHFMDASSTLHSGVTMDAGITLRPVSQLALGGVGYNLIERNTAWAPQAYGGGVALLPIPVLLFVFDAVWQKVYGDSSRDQVTYYMGGGEFSFASLFAIRAGGGHDGTSKNNYATFGLSVLLGQAGAIDLGVRQDMSGDSKLTVMGVCARLFVPGM